MPYIPESMESKSYCYMYQLTSWHIHMFLLFQNELNSKYISVWKYIVIDMLQGVHF